jgi:HK97 family phage portal protein
MGFFRDIEYAWKHRGSRLIQDHEGTTKDSAPARFFYEKSYDHIEVVRRGTDLIVDSVAEIDLNITGTLPFKPLHGNERIRQKSLLTILNFRPNNVEDINTFRRELIMDYILTGNCYQYWDKDNKSLFHLPAALIEVKTSSTDKISHYMMNDEQRFEINEIIHTRDNSATSNVVGTSRLKSARRSIAILQSMLDFQEKFFDNGAIPGLIIQTPNILGDRIKQKLLQTWRTKYKPNTGGRSPMILDGDLKVNPLSQTKFSELEFEDSVESHETKILKALGVPPVLLNSGNNANLRPNIQLFYEMTVLPVVTKLIGSYERFFAYDAEPEVVKIRALRPELKDAGQYFTGLVNGGIMTPNEARAELRLDPDSASESDELRIPANIAGSAVDPAEGGRPPEEGEDD